MIRAALVAAGVAATSAACASAGAPMLALAPATPPASCRMAITPDGAPSTERIAWTAPARQQDRDRLDAWCRTTGPPVVASRPDAVNPGDSNGGPADLALVTWNLHVGSADLATLVARLRAGEYTDGAPVRRFVLLLQEAHRDDPRVPRDLPPGLRTPRALGLGRARGRADVVEVAAALGLSVYYVPSMRNGRPDQTDEDRGNAIVSTEPLSDFAAIELPFERQRRVAIAATVSGRTATGVPWTLRVASVHLESAAPARHLWVTPGGRARQTRGLLAALQPLDSLVVGGDFNTWFGYRDSTYKMMAAAMTDVASRDHRRTFAGILRLDHLFSRPPAGWTVTAHRLDDMLGSDHHPLLARLRGPLVADERVSP